MNVTPQTDIVHESGYIFRNRVVYEVKAIFENYYIIEIDGVDYYVDITFEWVEVPDNIVLDSRNQLDRAYDDLKQRDVDYIKVYKERMGIHVFKSYAQEDYYRHRKNTPTPDVGLPEGHPSSDK